MAVGSTARDAALTLVAICDGGVGAVPVSTGTMVLTLLLAARKLAGLTISSRCHISMMYDGIVIALVSTTC